MSKFDEQPPGPKAPGQKTLAILLTDLVGSTKLYQKLGDEFTRQLVRKHFDLLETQLKKYDGSLIKIIGDSILATFAKPKKALACAMAMQRALRDDNLKVPLAEKLSMRIGVHLGSAIVEKREAQFDVHGHAVNLATRIEELAEGDEILASWKTWRETRGLDSQAVRLKADRLPANAQDLDLVRVLWDEGEIAQVRKKHLEAKVYPSLARAITERKCLLVLGGEFSSSGAMSLREQMSKNLMTELGVAGRRSELSQAAAIFEIERDRSELEATLIKLAAGYDPAPPPVLRELANLPFDLVLSSEIDGSLEKAFVKAGRRVKKFVGFDCTELGELEVDQVGLIKIFGDCEDRRSLAITEEDQEERLGQLPMATAELHAALATRQLLFVGHRWNSSDFKRLYRHLSKGREASAVKSIGISAKVAPYLRGLWANRGLKLYATDELRFAEHLKQTTQNKNQDQEISESISRDRLVLAQDAKGSKRPYKFLSYFEEQDQDIFFGRDEEARKLYSLVVSNRLILLHAPSGAGKTSLLNAGVIPSLKKEGYVVIVCRAIKDPEQEIRLACLEFLGQEQDVAFLERPLSSRLSVFLKDIAQKLDRPLVIILDQFEEFFIRFSKKVRREFSSLLGEMVRDKTLNLRFVLSLRHDFLHNLSEFKTAIADIYHHEFALDNLTPTGMARAIEEPARLAGLSYQEGLIEQMLVDLGATDSEPPQLQILCDRLYDELAEGETEFTAKHYQRLGGVQGILGAYLEKFLNKQAGTNRGASQEVLKAMVTSLGTKGVITISAIAQELGKTEKFTDKVLRALVHARLVRKLIGEEDSYELSHECLIEEIGQWIEEKDRDLKKARELLRQELVNYQKFGLLMAPSRLEIVRAKEGELNLTEPERDLLRLSERSRRKKRRWYLAAVVAILVLGIGGSLAVNRYLKVGLCLGAQEKLAGVWNPEQKNRIRHGFAKTSRHYAQDTYQRVEKILDQYAQDWVAMSASSCQATRIQNQQPEKIMMLRTDCLQRRLSEFNALVTLFARHADNKTVDQSVPAALGLTPIRACADIKALTAAVPPPEDPAQRKKVEAIRKTLDQISAQKMSGKYQEGLTLAQKTREKAKEPDYPAVEAESLLLLADLFRLTAQYEKAIEILEECSLLADEAKHDVLRVEAYNLLILVIGDRMIRLSEVEPVIKRAKAALARLGDRGVLKAQWLNNTGNVFYRKGDYDRALSHYEQAKRVFAGVLGQEHLKVGSLLHNIGLVFYGKGDYDQALNYYEQSLKILENILGSEHPKIANSLNNMGTTLIAKEEFQISLSFLTKALKIRRSTLRSDHPKVATSLFNIGLTHFKLGDFDRALKHYQQALNILEKSFGAEHPNVAISYGNIGSVMIEKGAYAQALVHYEKALEIREKSLGPDHLKVAINLKSIGQVFYEMGEYDRALAHFEAALQKMEKAVGLEHQQVAFTHGLIGMVLLEKGKFGQALSHFEQSKNLYQKIHGPKHPLLSDSLSGMALVKLHQKKDAEAKSLFEHALSNCGTDKCIGEDRGTLSLIQFNLAKIQWKTGGDRKKAIQLVRQARDSFKTEPSIQGKRRLRESETWLKNHRSE